MLLFRSKDMHRLCTVTAPSTRTAAAMFLLTFTLGASSAMHAQGTTATLGGVVTDVTGAIIPNASVVLSNKATSDKRQGKSNGSGVFNFSGVPVGDYDVAISAPGFVGFTQTGIHLDPGDQKTVRDISLRAGDATTVQVSTATDRIDIDSGEQSSLISAEEIKHLSVEGRDVTELLKILPGFAISNGGSGNATNVQFDPSQVSPTGALGAYAANGTPVNGQALLSDGVDITDPGAFGGALQNINYEQVAGGQGTNLQLHGGYGAWSRSHQRRRQVGWKQVSRLALCVRPYLPAELERLDLEQHRTRLKPPDRFVYPGGTFGGPVLIPGTNFNHRAASSPSSWVRKTTHSGTYMPTAARPMQ